MAIERQLLRRWWRFDRQRFLRLPDRRRQWRALLAMTHLLVRIESKVTPSVHVILRALVGWQRLRLLRSSPRPKTKFKVVTRCCAAKAGVVSQRYM